MDLDMLVTALMWVVTACAITVPLMRMAAGRLDLRRDAILLICYFQAVVYLCLIPSINVTFPTSSFAFPDGFPREIHYTSDTDFQYALLAFAATSLFLLPLLFVYEWLCLRSRFRLNATSSAGAGKGPGIGGRRHRAIRVSGPALFLFCAFSALMGIGYLRVAMREGLVSMRQGNETTLMLLNLSTRDFFFLRSFQAGGLFLIAVMIYGLCQLDKRDLHWGVASFLPALFASALYLINVLVNSRAQLFLTVGVAATVYITARGFPRASVPRRLGAVMLVAMCMWYGTHTIFNVRGDILVDGIQPRQFSPFYRTPSELSATTDLGARLDCLEMMVLMNPAIAEKGPAWGAAWGPALVVPFSRLISRDLERRIKASYITGAKQFLIANYTHISTVDYTSCMLTDVYGNFFILGFVLAAIAMAWVWSRIRFHLLERQSPALVVASLFMLSNMVVFEQDFSVLFTNWIRVTPLLMAALFLNPLRRSIVPPRLSQPLVRPTTCE